MELFIPTDQLKRYADETAAALSISGTLPGAREAAAARRCARRLAKAESGVKPGGAQRWLRDNLYLARTAADEVSGAFRSAGRLRAAHGRALIFRVAEAILSSGDGEADSARIEIFLRAFGQRQSLTFRELGLVGAALRLSILESLAALFAGSEPEERRAAVLFTSLRQLSNLELSELLERVDAVDRLLRADPADVYARMDARSRLDYRRRVAQLARCFRLTEPEVAQQALVMAEAGGSARTRHVGFYLFDRPLGRRIARRSGLGYAVTVTLAPAGLSVLLGAAAGSPWAGALSLFPMGELVKRLIDRRLLAATTPRRLPRLSLENGVPPEGKTLCVLSLLLTDEAAAARGARRLEELRASERGGEDLLFGLVCDLGESREFMTNTDRRLLECAGRAIEALNARYGGGFFLFTRDRVWHRVDRVFLPWERKRGATLELCRALAGDTSGMRLSAGERSELGGVRFLLTLDADTRPEPGCLAALIGTALHPLNRPVVDPQRGVVVRGHGILQPRAGVGLPDSLCSDFARLFSPPGGGDPYGAAGEVYMDRYDSGGFAGKGLIVIDAYLACLGKRLPEGRVLSHDALEGAFLRGGTLCDAEIAEGFPSSPGAYFSRAHRWIRGDWQNLPWLFSRGRDLPLIERWRLLDSLRRSLLPPALLAGVMAALLVPAPAAWAAAGIAALCLALPFPSGRERIRLRAGVLHGWSGWLPRVGARLLFLPCEAWTSLSAIGLALWRMGISGRNLLAWRTAEQAETSSGRVTALYREMWPSVVTGALLLAASPLVIGLAAGIVWLGAPALSASLGRKKLPRTALAEDDLAWLRRRAAEIWRYFHRFCRPETHYLPPDNVQETPPAPDAERVSPTNLGFALLGAMCAWKLGLAEKNEAVTLAGEILSTAEHMEKWAGHLYNWYDTRSLRPLEPRYVSTVDSGNLAACLIAVAGALNELGESGLAWRARSLYKNMDFAALYDRERHLFAIGRAPGSDAPPISWYDLLESEERLTGYIAVASGQAERRHWRALGRARVAFEGFRGMVSWSGTMFEYLMPELFLPLYPNSALGESARFAVYVQRRRALGPDKLWGVSESAFAALDASGHYRYKAHGVSTLALDRAAAKDAVVAPYASFLALAVTPRAAVRNLQNLERGGFLGPFGFWEAVDLSPGRAPAQGMAVQCVMTHHLGMSLAAVTNALCADAVRQWFLSDPAMSAHTSLLQERVPLGGALLRSRREAGDTRRAANASPEPRRGQGVDYLAPRAAALSNGSYHLLVCEDGTSRALCGGECPYVPRRDGLARSHGIELWLRQDGRTFPLLPTAGSPERFSWEFTADLAQWAGEADGISWRVSAAVSPARPGETREIALHRPSDAPAAELYFAFEPSLIPPRDHAAHPSFGRLGLHTHGEDGVLLVRRLSRGSRREHYMAVSADREVEWSSDFRTFPGRGGSAPFLPNEGWQSEPFTAARIRLPAGETESSVRFCLCLGGDAPSAKSGAVALLRESAARSALSPDMEGDAFNEAMELAGALARPRLSASARSLPAGGRQALWKNRLSGDRPIWAVVCSGEQSVPAAKACLRRFALLRQRGVECELVFLTGDEGDYRRACRAAIEAELGRLGLDSQAVCFASLTEDGEALRAVAAVWSEGEILALPERQTGLSFRLPEPPRGDAPPEGRFEEERFTFSNHNALPQRCWSLPLTGSALGWMATDTLTGSLWYKNARECPLIPWSGDPLAVEGPERLWIEVGGQPVSLFTGGQVTFEPGAAVWETIVEGDLLRLTAFLPPERDVRVFLLECDRAVSVRWIAPLQMAPEPEDAFCCYVNFNGGVWRAENPRCAYSDVTLYARCSVPWEETATDALAYAFGRCESAPRSAHPAFCGSFLLRGEAVLLCGTEDAPDLLDTVAARAALERCRSWWRARVGCLTAEGVDDTIAPLLNTWSVYQTLACRIRGRASVYQSGGAVGFRDQLQDHVNLLAVDAQACREHILACCAHQFAEGDVQHWWHPGENQTDKGVRTRCSDDLVWLPWAVCEYVSATGDQSLCDERPPYITAPALGAEESSRYEAPALSGEDGSVLDHCRRALGLVLDRGVGAHHLLLMGGGDWNDGFDALGPGGESVWLTFFVSTVCHRFAALLEDLGQDDAARYKRVSLALGEAADAAWDGDHYLRGYYGDGTPLGAGPSPACRIDSVAQSFAAFCPHASPDKVRTALDTALRALRDPERHRTLLYAPPFPPEGRAPGYVASYGPGFRENGGQYTHAAVWLARALFVTGRWADGAAILRDIALAAGEETYGAEPYAIAADVYAAPGQAGRAGWSWYTGAAGWWQRTIWENMLGFTLRNGQGSFAPPPQARGAFTLLRYRGADGSEITFPPEDRAK